MIIINYNYTFGIFIKKYNEKKKNILFFLDYFYAVRDRIEINFDIFIHKNSFRLNLFTIRIFKEHGLFINKLCPLMASNRNQKSNKSISILEWTYFWYIILKLLQIQNNKIKFLDDWCAFFLIKMLFSQENFDILRFYFFNK